MTPVNTEDNRIETSPRPREGASERVDRSAAPRRLADKLDEVGLDLAIQASTSRIVGLALAQRSLDDDSDSTREEGP